MISFIASLLKPLLNFLAVWAAGRSAGQNAAKIVEYNHYVETSKRIDTVESVSDAHVAAEWLRLRAKRERDL